MAASGGAAPGAEGAGAVLVDMDGVLADFELQFLTRWRAAHPAAPWVPLPDRREHYVDQDPSGAYATAPAHAVITSPGFYESMPPVAGAVDALRELAGTGLPVRICTAPFGRGEVAARCEEEKRQWVARHLGEEWLTPARFVCVKDKTTVPGALLIDDKPAPEQSRHCRGPPPWRHVVFSQPFNADAAAPVCRGRPRLPAWAEWRRVVLPLLRHAGGS